jgi:hypothetical protein
VTLVRSIDDNLEVVVFTVSRHRNTSYRRVFWRMSKRDAMKVCSDPRTAGQSYMLVFTGENIDDPDVNRYVRDGGQHARVLTELGVTVLDSFELRA